LLAITAAIPNMKLVMEKNNGEKKTQRPNSERVGASGNYPTCGIGQIGIGK
jgi:hypothetical protein